MLTETRPERGTPHPPQTLLQDGLVMSLLVRHDTTHAETRPHNKRPRS